MAYYLHDLSVSGVDFDEVLGCRIAGGIGTHGTLEIYGYTAAEEAVFYELPCFQEIEVSVGGPGDKQILFSGVISNITFESLSGMNILKVEGKSSSYRMDRSKHSRSFQDTGMSYMAMINLVMKEYPESALYYAAPEVSIERLFVQYEETDWQFLVRIMSAFGLTMTPDCRQKGIRLYAGLPVFPEQEAACRVLRIEKDMGAFYALQANGYEVHAANFTRYEVSSHHLVGIFEQIKVGNYLLSVSAYEYDFTNQELEARYVLQHPQGLLTLPKFPMHLIGVALNGTICGISGSNVQVMLLMDREWGLPATYWFPYSTISASPDGSGWYCMPEQGDTVRIYFPSKYEQEAIALSSVSTYDAPDNGQNDRMEDPDYRYLRTRDGQELSLTPDFIRLSCGDGLSSITLQKEGDVCVNAQKKIELDGTERVSIRAEEDMMFHTQNRFQLQSSQGGKVKLEDGDVGFYGTEVKYE